MKIKCIGGKCPNDCDMQEYGLRDIIECTEINQIIKSMENIACDISRLTTKYNILKRVECYIRDNQNASV